MAMFMKYQVGSCWSAVEDNKLAGCLSYYADLKDAAKHALEVGTGVQPMEVYVDLELWGPKGRLDYLDKPFKSVSTHWSEVKPQPVIRLREALELIAR